MLRACRVSPCAGRPIHRTPAPRAWGVSRRGLPGGEGKGSHMEQHCHGHSPRTTEIQGGDSTASPPIQQLNVYRLSAHAGHQFSGMAPMAGGWQAAAFSPWGLANALGHAAWLSSRPAPSLLRSQMEVVRCPPGWGPDTQPPAPHWLKGKVRVGEMSS